MHMAWQVLMFMYLTTRASRLRKDMGEFNHMCDLGFSARKIVSDYNDT